MADKKFFSSMGRGIVKGVRKASILGLVVLGACAGRNIRGPGPFERVALEKDIRAASLTFAPGQGSNPTDYAVMGITRDLEGKIHASPYFGHFQTAANGHTYWKLEYIPNADRLDDPASNIFNLGAGESLLGGKLKVGGGVSVLGDKLTKQIAGAFDLDPNTKITYSADTDFLGEGRLQASHNFGRIFDGPAFMGLIERDFGEKSWKIGASIEAGDYGALDAYYNMLRDSFGVQYSHGFGEKSEHFWYIGLEYDPINKEPTFFLGVNFTKYNRGNPRRRKKGKGAQPHSAGGPEPMRVMKRIRVDPRVARALIARHGVPLRKVLPAPMPRAQRAVLMQRIRERKAVESRARMTAKGGRFPAKSIPGRRRLAAMRRR